MKRISLFQKKTSSMDEEDINAAWDPSNTAALPPSSEGASQRLDRAARPNYRGIARGQQAGDEEEEGGGDSEIQYQPPQEEYDEDDEDEFFSNKAEHIEKSAGTTRLNRILRDATPSAGNASNVRLPKQQQNYSSSLASSNTTNSIEKVSNPRNPEEVARFVERRVLPPLRVDATTIGGQMLEQYPDSMQQECLYAGLCNHFESTGNDAIHMASLQNPNEYGARKRSLGLVTSTATTTMHKSRLNKVRYVMIARSTNRPLLAITQQRQLEHIRQKQQLLAMQEGEEDMLNLPQNKKKKSPLEESADREDYDTMFAPEQDGDDDDDISRDLSMNSSEADLSSQGAADLFPSTAKKEPVSRRSTKILSTEDQVDTTNAAALLEQEEEISSFPVLICMMLQNDGTGPDIRKLVPLDQLTTVQDVNSTVVQLAFRNGDTIRVDFGTTDEDSNPLERNVTMDRPLDKERFIWSLLQIHAMLCVSVVERNSNGTIFLPPLNVRNLDRAEIQYVATVNGFIKKDEALRTLLERQRKIIEQNESSILMIHSAANKEGKSEDPYDMDVMTYDLMMGNFATRVTLFHSEEERKDAEEILNSPEWTDLLLAGGGGSKEDSAAINVAERLSMMLQSRMRDLEAETCRRLIAWEDEKHISVEDRTKLHDISDARDTVDALALASLFKTLESLDNELKAMEDWLQDRAAAIKPLTDDCADIEEENRQLEQQWKSYDTLGAEMRRLLHGQELDEATESILKNPASVLVYDEDGLVNVEDSEDGIERMYEAGKTLLDAIEFPQKCGGIHLKAVAERARGLSSISNTFCSSLAQIIVTVMEQFKTEVVAGSDHGKVSKNDTHSMIAKKIRDTQRKFQSALLSYIKLIEVLAALNPDMLPPIRDAYAEMVAEGILMKKRMKGYFQALPGKNAACMNRVGKNIKDYVPANGNETRSEELVNAPDIRAVLSELLPVIAREAYFTSALFGSMNREQDGREKKRNFENAKNAVDKASVHFRYYLNRTCGVVDATANEGGEALQKGDPLLSLVATIYLNEVMDNYVDREKKGGDHSLSLAYVRATILDLRKKADKQWVTWVESQIEWIKSNDGVPLTGKRAGLFPSFARFPAYLDHVISCCKEGRDADYFPDLPGIKVINYYLQKMAVTLLESLKDCARRETTDQAYAAHVMQMENTYHFTQAIKDRGEVISKLFAKQVTKANAICKESTDAYLGWMIKREFTALHELFSRVSKIRKELGDSDVVSHVPKTQFVKILQKEANRDILKEKIGAMYSRMEKHLSEDSDLLPVAWKALVKVLYEWFGRWEKLCTTLYKHKLDPSSVDVVRIAKAAGGTVKPKVATQGTEFGFKSILALGNKQNPQT